MALPLDVSRSTLLQRLRCRALSRALGLVSGRHSFEPVSRRVVLGWSVNGKKALICIVASRYFNGWPRYVVAAMLPRIFRIFAKNAENCEIVFWACLLGMGGLFVWYGWFVVVWNGRSGFYLLFHNKLIAKLFGEYLSFFQLPLILVARLK